MASSIEVRGISGLVANIHAAKASVQRRVREAMREVGEGQHAATVREAPKRTGFLASKTRLDFSPEGLTYTVGYDAADFAEAGVYPYFFPVILGSSTQSANDFLGRVHEAYAGEVTRKIGQAVREGLRS